MAAAAAALKDSTTKYQFNYQFNLEGFQLFANLHQKIHLMRALEHVNQITVANGGEC